MNPDDPPSPPPEPAFAEAIPLDYANPRNIRRRPGSITAIGVIGIVLSAFALLAAANTVLQTVVLNLLPNRGLATSSGAMAVGFSEAIVGAALGLVLLVGSIAALRLRFWSRRLLLWWAAIYLLSAFIFPTLQVLFVIPAQMNMYNILATLPPPTTSPTTMPMAAGAAPATLPAAGGYSTSVITTTNGTTVTTKWSSGYAGPPPAQEIAMMRTFYVAWIIGRAAICLIFPIALLIMLNRKTARAVFSMDAHVNNNDSV